jgi:hypothetical protein
MIALTAAVIPRLPAARTGQDSADAHADIDRDGTGPV